MTTATAGTDLVARVTPGGGVIYDAAYASAGPYVLEVPAQVEVPLGERPGAGMSRIALVIARVYDEDVGAGPGRGLQVEVVPGVAAPSPSKPALPDLSLELAAVTIPSTGTPSVVASTARTVAAGGVLPVPTVAAMEALPSPYPGLAVYVEAIDALHVRGADGWRRYAHAEDTGWVTSGLDIAGRSWTLVTGYSLRKLNGWVTGHVDVENRGGAITSDSVGNISPDSEFFTMPAGWGRDNGAGWKVPCERFGITEMAGRIHGRVVSLTHLTAPNVTVPNGSPLRFYLNYTHE